MRLILPLLLCLLVAAGCVGLGLWQLDRAGQKDELLQAHAAALQAPPLPLGEALAGAEALRRAGLDPPNRQPPNRHPQRVQGSVSFPVDLPWLLLDNQRRGSQVGVRVYRIGEVAGLALLVEFGWLPLPADRTLPTLAESPDDAGLSGLLLSPPSAGLRLATNPPLRPDPAALLMYLDPLAIGDELGVALHAAILRPDPALPFGFARDADPLPNTLPPEKHRGYALQWFGLATTALVGAGLLLYRRLRPR